MFKVYIQGMFRLSRGWDTTTGRVASARRIVCRNRWIPPLPRIVIVGVVLDLGKSFADSVLVNMSNLFFGSGERVDVAAMYSSTVLLCLRACMKTG